jgi:multidrug/hemolysin transport system ATP-binding protein
MYLLGGIHLDNAIEVKNLVKNYKEIEAVKGISFYVEKGTLFAFLGPNGAGKSTTINIICTLLSYNAGEVIVNDFLVGHDDSKIRDDIGIVFQDSVLDPLLTVRENLETRGSFYNIEKKELKKAIDEALHITDITDIANRRFGTLSGGQKRRADIARALINEPKILFLDEPTTGLDPQTRLNVWQTIQKLQKSKNMTVFLTTHYLEEADEADYVVIIDNGIIVAKGTPSELKDNYSNDFIIIKPKNFEQVLSMLNTKDFVVKNDVIKIPLENTLDAIHYITLLKDYMKSFQVLNGTLDDAFINITGKEMR